MKISPSAFWLTISIISSNTFAANPPRVEYWELGDPVPSAPTTPACLTVEEYYWTSEACAVEIFTWKDYCWWMKVSDEMVEEQCDQVRKEVWLDPSLADPQPPIEACYLPIDEQSEDCADQWATYEEQCLESWKHKRTD